MVAPINPTAEGLNTVDGSAPSGASQQSAGGHSLALGAFALVVSLFFLWGVANNLNDILIKQFKKAFELSDLSAGLVQSAFYLGYFFLAIPAGICTRRLGYKGALLIGLGLYAAGALVFYPAALLHTYSLFLFALFIIASGLAFLETSANPLVTVLGPANGAARRLNLAQSFNPLGSITGVVIGQHFILSGIEIPSERLAAMGASARQAYFASESAVVGKPYLIIAAVVIVWAVLIAITRFPSNAIASEGSETGGSALYLGRNRNLVFAVVAQFFYVGAQVGVWSFLIRYAQSTLPGTPEKTAANYLTISLVAFMVGRFVGTALMRYLSPSRLLFFFAALNVALSAIAMSSPGGVGIVALILTSFFMSVMFPTIFALGLKGLDDNARKLGSSFLVMAIIGGAVLTAIMGAVSDAVGIARAVGVPMVCFGVVTGYALHTLHEPSRPT